MIRALATAFAFVAATTATAQTTCPTRNDLADGVRLERTTPYFGMVFTQTRTGLNESRVMERNGRPEAVSTVYAHPLATKQRIGQSGTFEIIYQKNVRELNRLNVTGRWSSPIRLLQDGRENMRGEVVKTFLGTTTFVVGNCQYPVWIVRDQLWHADGRLISNFEHLYSPAAGLVLLATKLDENDQPVSNVMPDVISINQ